MLALLDPLGLVDYPDPVGFLGKLVLLDSLVLKVQEVCQDLLVYPAFVVTLEHLVTIQFYNVQILDINI